MKFHRLILAFFAGLLLVSCSNNESKKETSAAPADTFTYVSETFGDVRVLRYQVPGFETLDAKQKEMLYYLYEAALSGREARTVHFDSEGLGVR